MTTRDPTREDVKRFRQLANSASDEVTKRELNAIANRLEALIVELAKRPDHPKAP